MSITLRLHVHVGINGEDHNLVLYVRVFLNLRSLQDLAFVGRHVEPLQGRFSKLSGICMVAETVVFLSLTAHSHTTQPIATCAPPIVTLAPPIVTSTPLMGAYTCKTADSDLALPTAT